LLTPPLQNQPLQPNLHENPAQKIKQAKKVDTKDMENKRPDR